MAHLCTRREFLKLILKGAAVFTLSNFIPINKFIPRLYSSPAAPLLYVFSGHDYGKLIREGFKTLGGINKFVKSGDYVVIKPNAAWERKPEEAANTHPDLVEETVRLCLEAGARKVDVIENPCDNWQNTFKINGIGEAVKRAGGNMIPLTESAMFKDMDIENAKILKKTKIAKHVLEADCFINMPIAKDHGSATLTMAMKNYMGIVKDRGFFHVNGLHQCIADISSRIKPNLNILDCTRILITNGPKGPGNVKVLNKIIFGTDQVSVDSLGATLFGFKPHDIGYIKIAKEMGLGRTDIENLYVENKKCF